MKTAPFRADHVGSLLRPKALIELRSRQGRGQASAAELALAENEAIEAVIARQEALGLRGITDGELRRDSWLLDFFAGLRGTRVVERDVPAAIRSADPSHAAKMRLATVVGKVSFGAHPLLDHFRFLKEHTRGTAKMTIPSPTMLITATRPWNDVVDTSVYPDVQELYHDLGLAYRDALRAFYDAGCRYLQFDDVNLAYLCDTSMRVKLEARGDDPDELLETWVRTLSSALSGRPEDMVVTTHICRGNFRSKWFAQGGYEAICDALFNRLDYDGYFLEYDSERAGGFEPLRLLPKGHKRVVLGLLTTKSGGLEDKEAIRRRVEMATRLVPLEQLALSPQCGFASTHEGNDLTEQQQWDKLAEVVELAREIWSDA